MTLNQVAGLRDLCADPILFRDENLAARPNTGNLSFCQGIGDGGVSGSARSGVVAVRATSLLKMPLSYRYWC